jgi:hypothetical protein
MLKAIPVGGGGPLSLKQVPKSYFPLARRPIQDPFAGTFSPDDLDAEAQGKLIRLNAENGSCCGGCPF